MRSSNDTIDDSVTENTTVLNYSHRVPFTFQPYIYIAFVAVLTNFSEST